MLMPGVTAYQPIGAGAYIAISPVCWVTAAASGVEVLLGGEEETFCKIVVYYHSIPLSVSRVSDSKYFSPTQ